ncbi:MAG: pyrroline-5-carboxylate reductase [Dehalococcoidia bacterium]|nr:pyrroline-5-carboxylate reductase [Dehalococcoidia bacterium]MSQ16911.1 pyrroline-5-carboxylate reductase [Dehalococcoidia bacterium]
MKLAFIGGGVMAEAILGGVLAAKIAEPGAIHMGEPRPERRQALTKQYGVHAFSDNLMAAHDADLVILAIKPQDLPSVFRQLKGHLSPQQAALSIIAGAKMSTLSQGLGHPAIIRVMPNTPAQIRCGMSLWTCSKEVGRPLRDATKAILGTVGVEIHVEDEKYLDMATALSASGPAYVFLFIEALIDAGVFVGLPRDMARTLALQTVLGSTRLVMETGKHPGELKDMVVSPGGTTAEALQILEHRAVPGAVVEAVNAAYQKSIKLGQG